MLRCIHGDGQRFAPEPGQEVPMAEQFARLQFLLEHVDLDEKTVLDCGCGTGYSLDFLLSHRPEGQYVGIDQEHGAVSYAKGMYEPLQLVVMNGLHLGFQPASFDVVLSFEVLEHMSHDKQRDYISEIYCVLKPGGMLVLSTPNRDVFSQGYHRSLNRYHINELSLTELQSLLAERFHAISLYGQYFRHLAMRQRDIEHLRQQFALKKRLKRSMIRFIERGKDLGRLYSVYKRVFAKESASLYPFAIASEDFAFDTHHVDIAKWFVCLCQK